jgi:sulfite exporter TauE/SafE
MTESELMDLPYLSSAKSSLASHTVVVEGRFGDKTPEEIASDLTTLLRPHGYTISVERQIKEKKCSDFKIALPIALAFAVLFFILQKVGLVNLVDAGNVTYGTAFIMGIVASLSTCMAVVGGLVLSMSATFAKEGDRVKPQLMFHGGRIVSFFILGGVIGAVGSAFTLNTGTFFALSFVIGLVMLILGVNLLDVFPWAKRLQPSMPQFIARHAHGVSRFNHTLTPLIVGVATFFLPCGFTQSMQLYTLSTGSFLAGGLTMLSFALGTLPVLALMSFSLSNFKDSPRAGIFFKSAGLIVIMFALFNLINSLVVIGLIPPVFNF